MTQDEAENIIRALMPKCLSTLQTEVLRGSLQNWSYDKIALELKYYQYSYIKDVGADLWKLLSQALGIKVTKTNLQNALRKYVQQEQIGNHLPASSQRQRVDWGEAPDTYQFRGRQKQLETLEQWVTQEHCRLVAIAGMGGIGKTMLATKLTQQLADTDMFDVVVWRSLRQAPPLINLLRELVSAIAPEQSPLVQLDVTMRQLLEQLRHHRCLLILDNVEAVFSSSELAGTYRPGYEDYGWLFQQLGTGQHQSSVLLTSREIPAEVAIQYGSTAAVRLLRLESLSFDEGEIILAAKGLTFPAESKQGKELIKRYRGNPLALQIVATPIKELFNSNIAAFLDQEALLFTEIRGLLAQQFNRLSSLERQVMYWLAINREAVTAAQLQADIIPSVSPVELRDALVSLDRRSLIEKIKLTSTKPITQMKLDCVSYTQQPVVMEYVTEQLVERVCQEVEQAQIVYLRSYALLKAQAKDDVRDMQRRLIVQPILARLREVQGGSENLKQLLQLLKVQQLQGQSPSGYFAENVLDLLLSTGADLRHLDLSKLTTWQASLRTMNLPETNFSFTKLSQCIFTQSINNILCVAFSSNPKYIATNKIAFWNNSLIFSPDIVESWDMPPKEGLKTLEGQPYQGWLSALAFFYSSQTSAQTYFLARTGRIRTIWLWDIQSGYLSIFTCIPLSVLALAFRVIEPEVNWISSVAFSPSKPCLGKEDKTVKLQNWASISFQSQRNLLVCSGFERTFNLWDLQTGIAIVNLQVPTSPIRSIAFDPEERMLISSSEDGTILLWDGFTGECLKVLIVEYSYEDANILSVMGLTDTQKKMLQMLDARKL